MIEKLILFRNILLRTFVVAFLFLLFSFLMCFLMNDFIVDVWTNIYSIDQDVVPIVLISFMGLFKLLMFLFLLIPAIGLHWTIRTLQKKQLTETPSA